MSSEVHTERAALCGVSELPRQGRERWAQNPRILEEGQGHKRKAGSQDGGLATAGAFVTLPLLGACAAAESWSVEHTGECLLF